MICEVRSFGARRQYHSYHHISQSKGHGRTIRGNNGKTIDNQDSSSSSKIAPQDETEILLERAARIRALSAQINGVQYASRKVAETNRDERRYES